MNVGQLSTAAGLIVIIGGGGASLGLIQSTAASADERSIANTVSIAELTKMLTKERVAKELADAKQIARDAERIRLTAKFCAISDFRATNEVKCAMNDIEQEEGT